MKILVVENYPNSPLGNVGEALAERDVQLDTVIAHGGQPIPDGPNGYDGLIMLGGAQSALDDDDYPFLPALARLTRAFGDSGRAVLGICLGSQIIARAYNGGNVLDRPLEFGYRPVFPLPEAAEDPVLSVLTGPSPTFHWHKDTVTLPPGAVRLAESEMTANQAWRIGNNVYASQFHFEASAAVVGDWSVQARDHILEHAPEWPDMLPLALEKNAGPADRLGLELGRRWVTLAQELRGNRRD
ncbi:type 1 glutamine amidotransferase [Microbaculum marinum]|uniref:Type 1 glutamine amidotransferase n=1 Tax=Microbaculum marinum TaxID=1764581 RepID=A0AAW9RLD9_9HYPH